MSSLSNFLSFTPSKHTPLPFHFPSLTCSRDGFLPMTRNWSSLSFSYSSSLSSYDLSPVVIRPSLAHANTLCFASGYNVQVLVDENESEESLIRKFRFKVFKAGVIQECKRRRFFENKQEEKKRKARGAAQRNRRRRYSSRVKPSNKQEESKKKKDEDEEEDNWELPEGELPY